MPKPSGLTVDLLAHPERALLTNPVPVFSWVVPTGGQSAYQIRVGTFPTANDLWGSGRVTSGDSVNIRYAGKPLPLHALLHWSVRLWDAKGQPGEWSASQAFRTGKIGTEPRPTRENAMTKVGNDWLWENRHPLVTEERTPKEIVKLGEGRYFLDFGTDWFGTLKLTAPADTEITVHLAERLAAPRTIDRKPPGSVTYREAKLTLKANSTQTLTVPPHFPDSVRRGMVSLPSHLPEVCPLRYVEIEGWPGELRAENVRLLTVHALFDEDAAHFSSADPMLDAIWAMGKHTFQAASFLGVSVDGERERTPYEADAYIAQLGHLHCDTDFAFWRHTLAFLLTHSTWPTEWAFHLIFMAHADWTYTGNTDFVVQHYDALLKKLLREKTKPDGLLLAGAIVDWPPAERDGFGEGRKAFDDSRHTGPDVNTVANAFYLEALRQMAELAAAIGKTADAIALRTERERVLLVFQRMFFDPIRGLYIDGEGSTHASLHANLFPLAFGLVPKDDIKPIADFLVSKGMACSVYAAQYLLEALYIAGRDNDALKLYTAPGDRSWRHMVEGGSGMAWEAWDAKYKPNLTWNHAWGAAPSNLIPRFLMGIRPLEAGMKKILIAPQPGSLPHAKLTMPTLRGPVTVAFEQRRSFTLDIEIPETMTAVVRLPGQNRVQTVGPGKHRF